MSAVHVAMVVNSFPVVSETFILNKVMALRAAGLDVTVYVHQARNDLPLFRERLGRSRPKFVRSALTAFGGKDLPVRLARAVTSHPNTSRALWRQAASLYGPGERSFKAWVMALPLVLGQFDIIHFEYSGLAVGYLDALPLLKPARLVTSCRGAAEQITPLVRPERAEQLRRLFPQIDRVHCVTRDMQRTVEQYGLRTEQVFVNYPSIEVERFQRFAPYPLKDQGPYRLLSVGRLHWKKGLEYALLAVRYLLDQGEDVHYEIIGAGREEEQLRFTINDLALSEHVTVRGSQPAEVVRQTLETADVFLLPSLSEGLSNAVLEAMAMEVPVVSTTAGGMAEAIDHSIDGFLVPSRQPAIMAERVKELLGDPLLRKRMGQAGRRKIEEKFTLQRQVDCFINEYQSLFALRRQEAR